MAKKSLAETLSNAQLMVKALQGRGTSTIEGVTEERKNNLSTLTTKLINANAEQEKLKAQLKEKTTEVEDLKAQVEKEHSTIKKFVKISVQKELWKEFGIEDKQ